MSSAPLAENAHRREAHARSQDDPAGGQAGHASGRFSRLKERLSALSPVALKERLRELSHAALAPAVAGARRIGLTADFFTVLGLVLCAGSGLAFFDGHSRLGALLLLCAGLCDMLDGEVARHSGGETRFGAFFDSILDRLGESLVLLGILGFCLRNLVALVFRASKVIEQMTVGLFPVTWAVVAATAALALIGSFMVSYTRARAEGLGLECKVGWFERPERLLLLVVAGALQVFWAMSAALLLLTLFSFFTAAQRVAHVWKHTRGAGLDR